MYVKENNANLSNYLTAALVINSKEWFIRIRKNTFRFILIFFLGLLMIYTIEWLGIAYFTLLLVLIIVDFFIELVNYWKMAKHRQKQYPDGIMIEFDDEGFRKKVIEGFEWEKIPWSSIAFAFDNKAIRNFALYHQNSKEYHLIFAQNLKKNDYSEIRKLISEKVNRIY